MVSGCDQRHAGGAHGRAGLHRHARHVWRRTRRRVSCPPAAAWTVSIDNPVLVWLGAGWSAGHRHRHPARSSCISCSRRPVRPIHLCHRRQSAVGAPAPASTSSGTLLKIYMLSACLRRVSAASSTPRAMRQVPPMPVNRCCSIPSPPVVIGGASLFGGTGNVIGTLIGALDHRRHPVRPHLHRCRCLLAVHRGRRRHHLSC